MLTKLKDRLDHLMSSKLKWELSRGKATAARAKDEAEHAMKVFAIRVYGARGAAAVRAFDAARALRAPGRRRRQRGVALPRSNRRSPIRKTGGGRGGGSRLASPSWSRARRPSNLRICNRFARVLKGYARSEYNP